MQRLRTLERFTKTWINSEIRDGKNRPVRAKNMIENTVHRLVTRLGDVFEKCGFFDPSIPHGGPNPETQRT